jgi:hypothetical protein
MTKFLFYKCRHGDYELLTPHDERHWNYLIDEMYECDKVTPAEAEAEGWTVDGSVDYNENANLSIDDGGTIKTIELSELNE